MIFKITITGSDQRSQPPAENSAAIRRIQRKSWLLKVFYRCVTSFSCAHLYRLSLQWEHRRRRLNFEANQHWKTSVKLFAVNVAW